MKGTLLLFALCMVLAQSALGQTVRATKEVSDKAIETRLERIFKASEKFEDLKVSSREGIVTIEGEALTPEARDFANTLAKSTEGVIYVNSELEVARPDEFFQWSQLKSSLEELKDEAFGRLPRFLLGGLVLIFGLLALRFGSRFTRPFFEKKYRNPFLAGLMSKALIAPFLIIFIYLALQVTGLTKLAVTVLTGTGLMGLAIGIAFRNIAENFFASVLLSVQRPFEIGDLIKIGEHLGYVRQLTSRGTTLMTLDGNHVQVPNALAYTQTLTNYTANKNMRESFTVGVGFDCDIARAQELAVEAAYSHPSVLNEPEPLALVESLGAATVNLGIYFWLDSTKYSQFKVKSSMIRMVKRAFEQHDISMPDEAREIVFPEGVPVVHDLKGQSRKEAATSATSAFGEGDLKSESHEIEKQAINSRKLEGGENLLET